MRCGSIAGRRPGARGEELEVEGAASGAARAGRGDDGEARIGDELEVEGEEEAAAATGRGGEMPRRAAAAAARRTENPTALIPC